MSTSLAWLVQNSPLLLAAMDRSLICRYISEPWREILGMPRVHKLARPGADLFGPENRGLLLAHLEEVVAEGGQLTREPVSLKGRDGNKQGELSAWQVKIPVAEQPWLLVSVREVTDQRETLGELSRLHTLQQLILNAAGEGIFGVDAQGRTTFVSEKATQILGWHEKDLLGQILHDVIHHTHEDGGTYARDECPIYAAFNAGQFHQVEAEVFWRADANSIPVEYSATPIRRNGKLDGAVVVFRDVSERREKESKRSADLSAMKKLNNQLKMERKYLREEVELTGNFGEIIGKSKAMQRTLTQIRAVAATQANVLVQGEPGVGKGGIARAIHAGSERAEHAFVRVNCASIPADQFEKELFGCVQEAIAEVDQSSVGKIELAEAGTLFLDDVGKLPLAFQSKLLRTLQEKTYQRVGEERLRTVDLSVVAATDRDLIEDVKQGRFVEDLYYQLSVFPIAVPPLRERLDDLEPLAIHFLKGICREMGRPMPRMTRQQMARLKSYHWPGNVRELKTVLERALVLSPGTRLQLDLPCTVSAESTGTEPFVTDATIREIEKTNMLAVLRRTGFRVSGPGGAAELLGLKATTLAYRLKMFGIDKAGQQR